MYCNIGDDLEENSTIARPFHHSHSPTDTLRPRTCTYTLAGAREKNPANSSANKPSNFPASSNNSTLANTLVPTATCDPQPSLAPLAHPDKPHTLGIDPKNMTPAAIASATASVMYFDNYLAASNNSTPKYTATLTPAPPPLATVHDKPPPVLKARPPAKTHHHPSILRKPSHKSSTHRNLSKTHPTYASYSALATQPLLTTSGEQKIATESNPLQHSGNSVAPTQNTSTATSNLSNLNQTNIPNYAMPNNAPTPTKRGRASYLKSSNELKQSRIIYNPNIANNITSNNINNSTNNNTKSNFNHMQNFNNLNFNTNINNNITANLSSSLCTTLNNNINNINNNTLHHSTEISANTVLQATDVSQNQNMVLDNASLAASGAIARTTTPTAVETTENYHLQNNNHTQNHNNNNLHDNFTNTMNNNVNNNIKVENYTNGHRANANVEYLAYGAYNPYYPFPAGIPVHTFYSANPQIPTDTSVTGPEPVYTPRSEPQVSFDPAEPPPMVNPSNDLYSNLYLYSLGNNIYNNNNNNAANYARTQPMADINPAYNNLYSYNNLYLNNMYGGYPTYPIRQYSTPTYHSHKITNNYETQAYRTSSESLDENYDDEDYGDRPFSKSFAKRSKRRTTENDDLRKPLRKSKSRNRSKRHKQPQTYEEAPLHDSVELNTTITTSSDLPKVEGTSPAALTPPLSPARRAKASANLFENTPKIKIGDVPGGNAKISKLGKKLLEAVRLDWRTPFTPGDVDVSFM